MVVADAAVGCPRRFYCVRRVANDGGQQPSPTLVRPGTFGKVALSFYAETGTNYALQFTTSWPATNWQALTNVCGAGADAVIIDAATGRQRFYRVRAE